MKRTGQHADETTMEYLRRAVNNLNYEPESLLDDMPSVDAVLDYFDLWHEYGTDYWSGVIECIGEGDSPDAAYRFIEKHGLPAAWRESVDDAVNAHAEAR